MERYDTQEKCTIPYYLVNKKGGKAKFYVQKMFTSFYYWVPFASKPASSFLLVAF